MSLSLALLVLAVCQEASRSSPAAGGAAEGEVPIRDVRVLIASGAQRVRLRSEEVIRVADSHGATLGTYTPRDWIVIERAPDSAIRFGSDSISVKSLALVPQPAGGSITLSVYQDGNWSPGFRYPGRLHLSVADEGLLEVINLVDVERYVAGVVACEVWPTFDPEAYRAQAIISRTFVLYQMQRRNRADFDIAATPAAQVYRGLRADSPGLRAGEAARYTRGIVCSWQDNGVDRLFSTYYSSACGGESQSAAIFGSADAIEPLLGGVRCDYCKIAPADSYRWGPVRLTVSDVQSRLVARYPKLSSLGRLTGLTVFERTQSGRAVRLRLTGTNGQTKEITAERFRLALGGNVIRSTHCDIRLGGGAVIFENGRGFGHGLGLCQWGMQGQALAGKRAGEILRYYYPGCNLTRVY